MWFDYFEDVLLYLPPSLDLLIFYGVLLQVVLYKMLRRHTISDVWVRMFDALEHVCWDILLRKFGQSPYNYHLLHRMLGAYQPIQRGYSIHCR